jgi:hypothetical protein
MTVTDGKAPGKYLFQCEKPGCYRRLTFNSQEEAQADQDTHPCPWSGPTKVSWSVTKTLVEQMWEKLDADMAKLRQNYDTSPHLEEEKLKARMRAIAECIAIFMPPFFKSADDVAREALRRYEASQSDTDYETPGLGQRRYEAAVRAAEPHASAAGGWYGTPDGTYTSDPSQAGRRAPRATGRARTAAPADTSKVPDSLKETMRDFHKQMPSVFTAKQLAKTHGLSEAVVEAVLRG